MTVEEKREKKKLWWRKYYSELKADPARWAHFASMVKKRKQENPKQRDYLRKIRAHALTVMGGKCVKCGFSDPRALQIDHVNGGGSEERKKRQYSSNFHRHVAISYQNGENKYQLLCANCNWIKRFEQREWGSSTGMI